MHCNSCGKELGMEDFAPKQRHGTGAAFSRETRVSRCGNGTKNPTTHLCHGRPWLAPPDKAGSLQGHHAEVAGPILPPRQRRTANASRGSLPTGTPAMQTENVTATSGARWRKAFRPEDFRGMRLGHSGGRSVHWPAHSGHSEKVHSGRFYGMPTSLGTVQTQRAQQCVDLHTPTNCPKRYSQNSGCREAKPKYSHTNRSTTLQHCFGSSVPERCTQ